MGITAMMPHYYINRCPSHLLLFALALGLLASFWLARQNWRDRAGARPLHHRCLLLPLQVLHRFLFLLILLFLDGGCVHMHTQIRQSSPILSVCARTYIDRKVGRRLYCRGGCAMKLAHAWRAPQRTPKMKSCRSLHCQRGLRYETHTCRKAPPRTPGGRRRL